jgi:hypothetical protein
MEKEPQAFENYPLSTVLTTNGITLLIWVVSVYLVWQLGMLWGGLFIIYLIGLEFFVYKHGCSCCYYHSKRCAFGRGKIAPFIVKKDDPQKFCQRKVTWLNLLPVVLGSLIPIVAGVILLIRDFNWPILILTLIPLINWFFVNPLIYGKLICLHCQQGRLCCPANEFFGKKKD